MRGKGAFFRKPPSPLSQRLLPGGEAARGAFVPEPLRIRRSGPKRFSMRFWNAFLLPEEDVRTSAPPSRMAFSSRSHASPQKARRTALRETQTPAARPHQHPLEGPAPERECPGRAGSGNALSFAVENTPPADVHGIRSGFRPGGCGIAPASTAKDGSCILRPWKAFAQGAS